jgi:UDP-3-O-[3-hydroxymyristoyl] glucosamine N-acyltransferase
MNISEIAEKFQLKTTGPDCEIENLGKLDCKLSNFFSLLDQEQYLSEAESSTELQALITKPEFDTSNCKKTILFSENPRHLFYKIHKYLIEETEFYRKKEASQISPSAIIHPTAHIDEYNVEIGDNVVVGPNACIMEGTVIERNVSIDPGAVIGSQGFECYRHEDKLISVPHAGNVHLSEGVHIGANCTIDKAIFRESTHIGRYTKFDDLIHIGHGARIGERVILPAGITISGYVKIGNDVWVGVGSVILQRVTIGDNSKISIGSVVTKDVLANSQVTGNFAIDHSKFIENLKKSLN